jgi:hypothetical protein
MLLVDAVHGIETVGGIWLGMSAFAFILLVVFDAISERSAKRSAKRDAEARPEGLVLDLRPNNETKRALSKKSPARKAA